jgi:hypothetical protein
MIVEHVSLLGLGSKIERGKRNSMVKEMGASGCRGTEPNFLPLVDQSIATCCPGGS